MTLRCSPVGFRYDMDSSLRSELHRKTASVSPCLRASVVDFPEPHHDRFAPRLTPSLCGSIIKGLPLTANQSRITNQKWLTSLHPLPAACLPFAPAKAPLSFGAACIRSAALFRWVFS